MANSHSLCSTLGLQGVAVTISSCQQSRRVYRGLIIFHPFVIMFSRKLMYSKKCIYMLGFLYTSQFVSPNRRRPIYSGRFSAPNRRRPIYARRFVVPNRRRPIYTRRFAGPISFPTGITRTRIGLISKNSFAVAWQISL